MVKKVISAEDQSGDGFKSLFPKLDDIRLSHPFQTEVMVAMCNVAQYAFGAYENPTVAGFKETTAHGAHIQYLNPDTMETLFDGFLKIQLKAATELPRSWWWGSKYDPYVVFSVGSSSVRSPTIANTNCPIWNSTMFLPLRKRLIKEGEQDSLKISLYDDDKHGGWSVWKFIANALDKDDLLGASQLDILKLKVKGIRAFDLIVKDETTVHFTTEYISAAAVCKELGITKTGSTWMHSVGQERTDMSLNPKCSWVLDLGHLSAAPYAFFDSPCTDTQAWLHVYPRSKTVLVSFRGTEVTKLKDVLMDLTAFPTELRHARSRAYVLSPTDSLLNEDIRIHSGFLAAYESIREQLLQVIYDVTEWSEEWNVCCTGHSLGGALATLAAFEFKNRRNAKGKGPSIAMMNYGAPRVGNKAFVDLYDESLVHSYRVVDREDVVHLVPPGYIHTGKELLCRPNGEVLVEGIALDEFDYTVLCAKSCQDMDAFDGTGSLEEIFTKYGFELDEVAEKHVSKNYLSIIGQSVVRFFENKPTID